MTDEDEEVEDAELCWSCIYLYQDDTFFACGKDTDVMLEPIEHAVSDCKYFKEDRKKIRGAAVDLWKLLVAINKPVALHSVSKKMVGALGILKEYKLVKVEEGVVLAAPTSGKGRTWIKEKFVMTL